MKNLRQLINQEKNDESQLAVDNGVAHAERKLHGVMKEEPAVRKVVRAAAKLADFITPEDRAENARVIREAKNAVTRIYSKEKKDLIEVPDHKIRLAATTLELAYDEGTPLKRSISINADFKSAEDILDAMKRSPEAARAMRAISGVEVHSSPKELNTITESVKFVDSATV